MAHTTTITGKIIRLNAERGFGFIAPDDGSITYFFHADALPPGVAFDAVYVGARVELTPQDSPRGPRCGTVRLLG